MFYYKWQVWIFECWRNKTEAEIRNSSRSVKTSKFTVENAEDIFKFQVIDGKNTSQIKMEVGNVSPSISEENEWIRIDKRLKNLTLFFMKISVAYGVLLYL